MPTEDFYEEYDNDGFYQIEPHGANDVYFHNYGFPSDEIFARKNLHLEPVDDYIEYAAPIPVSHGNPNRGLEMYERRSSNVRPTFYGETTNRSHFTWKEPVHKTRVPSLSEEKESAVPFYSQTTSREAYSPKVAHSVAIKDNPEEEKKQQYVPFYSETTNRADYVEKPLLKENRFKLAINRILLLAPLLLRAVSGDLWDYRRCNSHSFLEAVIFRALHMRYVTFF
ncbi:unnamed protein product [Cylicostephanus goldi]|uniref:Uncharacterized protein n=1 Tax=Cylicostephanus goldi TaxID=71465 RepID=A0A3P6STN2_CYLGO|nr:unnamed protein product [Cylicostephanus goldi]